MPKAKLLEIRGHLLPKRTRDEQAGFLFARPNVDRGVSIALTYVDWVALSRNDFEHQSPYHLELRDETRARVIKRAHDLQCSLVEFHSHPGPWPAQFSASDFHGFDEFVPHVLWRLKGRPYVAVVVAPSGLDALAWITSSRKILGVSAVMLDNDERVVPTGLSLKAAEKGVAWTD
jgi:proteasome lid subunit RPN8/RPN11